MPFDLLSATRNFILDPDTALTSYIPSEGATGQYAIRAFEAYLAGDEGKAGYWGTKTGASFSTKALLGKEAGVLGTIIAQIAAIFTGEAYNDAQKEQPLTYGDQEVTGARFRFEPPENDLPNISPKDIRQARRAIRQAGDDLGLDERGGKVPVDIPAAAAFAMKLYGADPNAVAPAAQEYKYIEPRDNTIPTRISDFTTGRY